MCKYYFYVGYDFQVPRYSHEFTIYARNDEEAQERGNALAWSYGPLDLIRTKLVKVSD